VGKRPDQAGSGSGAQTAGLDVWGSVSVSCRPHCWFASAATLLVTRQPVSTLS
jgi:hypothetical protein